MANVNEYSTDLTIINTNEASQKKAKWAEVQLLARLEALAPKMNKDMESMKTYLYFRGCLDMLLVLNGELDIADMNQPFED